MHKKQLFLLFLQKLDLSFCTLMIVGSLAHLLVQVAFVDERVNIVVFAIGLPNLK